MRVLSNFIVNGLLNSEDNDLVFTEDTIREVANEMRSWDEFIFGDERLEDIGKEFMKRHNEYIKQNINDKSQFMESNTDVFKQVGDDADRFDWTINGQKFPINSDKNKVIGAFCQAVPDSKARKAISIIFNQAIQSDLTLIINKIQEDDKKIQLCKMPDANIFVSRDSGQNETSIIKNKSCLFDLKLSEDNKTATITVTSVNDLTLSPKEDKFKIGKANIAIQCTFDLTKEIPEVTNVAFSQTYSPDEMYVKPAK